MDKITTPQDIDTLLQLLAVLLDRVGGEIVISRKEFEMFEGTAVVGRYIAKDYVAFRLAEEEAFEDIEVIDLPETPQT